MAPTLYHLERCPFCEKVRLALALDGLEYESRLIDPDDRSDLERLTGQPEVPVLVEEDGTALFEANHILRHLVQREGSTLMPEGRRDQALTWVLVDRADMVLKPLVSRIRRRRTPEGRPLNDSDVAALKGRLREELAVLEHVLERGPFLFGSHTTVADIAAHAFLSRLPADELDSVFRDRERVAAWYRHVREAAYGTAD